MTDTKAATTSRPFQLQGNGGIINVLVAGGSLSLTGGMTGSGGVTISGLGTTVFNASSQSFNYNGDTTVTGGKLVLAGSNSLPFNSNLNVSAGAVVQVAQLATKTTTAISVIQANTLNLASNNYSLGTPGGIFDLTKNDLVLHNQTVSAVTAMVAAGYNLTGGGNWQGSMGITSSAAAADTSHLTAVGVISNTDSNGNQIYGNGSLAHLDGYSPSASDVLVKYTYFGDANLDGRVDGSDYSLIDAGYASQSTGARLSGWYNGDFNYDGTVDGSDYALIDNAFNNQTAQIGSSAALVATATAQVAGAAPTAVPEPASIGLIAAVAGLAARRRRR